MRIDPVKLNRELQRRKDMFSDEIAVAEIEGRLADIVAMKAAQMLVDVMAGALIAAAISDVEDQIPW